MRFPFDPLPARFGITPATRSFCAEAPRRTTARHLGIQQNLAVGKTSTPVEASSNSLKIRIPFRKIERVAFGEDNK